MDHHGSGLVRTAPWDSLPALRSLDLEGAFLFDSVDHDGLTRLRVRGPATCDGAVFDLGRTPKVDIEGADARDIDRLAPGFGARPDGASGQGDGN
ncbi:hypothetical protein [Kitasatospora sp. NPDC088346]|uniref:hypothetical protein n=1 Tax=Kitasatospora sp. NPDC088346 TaxID=3364073 RepID=UPI00381953E3